MIKKKAAKKNKLVKKRPVGRPADNVQKKIQNCIRLEPFVKEAILAKHGSLQAFVDLHAYKLVPKDRRPSKK